MVGLRLRCYATASRRHQCRARDRHPKQSKENSDGSFNACWDNLDGPGGGPKYKLAFFVTEADNQGLQNAPAPPPGGKPEPVNAVPSPADHWESPGGLRTYNGTAWIAATSADCSGSEHVGRLYYRGNGTTQRCGGSPIAWQSTGLNWTQGAVDVYGSHNGSGIPGNLVGKYQVWGNSDAYSGSVTSTGNEAWNGMETMTQTVSAGYARPLRRAGAVKVKLSPRVIGSYIMFPAGTYNVIYCDGCGYQSHTVWAAWYPNGWAPIYKLGTVTVGSGGTITSAATPGGVAIPAVSGVAGPFALPSPASAPVSPAESALSIQSRLADDGVSDYGCPLNGNSAPLKVTG